MRLLLLLVLPSLALAQPALPGPGPRPPGPHEAVDERAHRNGSCVACHEDIGREWQGSLHRQAWVDRVFQEAFLVEPLGFCRSCHAPESDPASAPTAKAQAVGVGCVTCHVQAGQVVAARDSGEAMHPVLADARLGGEQACAGCHQFDFPAAAGQLHPQPMQDTVREHARSRWAETPCQGCHMPSVRGEDGREHRSHAFAVVSNPEMIRRAVRVRAEASADGVVVTLTPDRVGHAFPTGDMFRRVEVRAWREQGGRRVSAAPVVLARSFHDVPRDPFGGDVGFMRVEAEDTRVPPPPPRGQGDGARAVTLALPRGPGRLHWQVAYQRMSTPMASAFGIDQVLDEIMVAEGDLEGDNRCAQRSSGGHRPHHGQARR
jgi:hypothetical protein